MSRRVHTFVQHEVYFFSPLMEIIPRTLRARAGVVTGPLKFWTVESHNYPSEHPTVHRVTAPTLRAPFTAVRVQCEMENRAFPLASRGGCGFG
jgi:hypothetical protein